VEHRDPCVERPEEHVVHREERPELLHACVPSLSPRGAMPDEPAAVPSAFVTYRS
jgi:hypothetical protein